MQLAPQKRLSILCLTLLGVILGAVAGFWVGRLMLLRAAKRDLSTYAQNMVANTDKLDGELHSIFESMETSPFAFCSDQQIVALQAATYRAHGLKDIGRTSQGKLYCSAFLGRLKTPVVEGAPALVGADGTRVYKHSMVPFLAAAASEGAPTTIIEREGTYAVVSLDALDRWGRPYVSSAIFSVNRESGRILQTFGSRVPVDPSLVLARDRSTISGAIYQSRCSAIGPLCVIAWEHIPDVWRQTRALQAVNAAMGALAGFGFGLALALLYLRTRAPGYQLKQDLINDSRSLRLIYQPLVDVATRRCVGAEALLRWTDHSGNTISPETFISIAEENGFIGEVTALVVRKATRELGDLLRQHREMTLSINIAAADLQGDDLFPLLKKHVEEAGIYPSQIALELTERSAANVTQVGSSINLLSREGYKVHIDDFGIGYSSLAYLEQLSVNAIKIDRAFTQSIGTDAVIAPVLPQIINLASALGIEVVVEGVETELQAQYLQATGKPLQVQGWLFGKPMTTESLAELWNRDYEQSIQPDSNPVALTSQNS